MTKLLFSGSFHTKVLTAFLLKIVYCCAVSVKKSHPDQLLLLPGLNFKINFKQYNGYLKVGEDKFLHYFFVESQRSPSQDPILLWLNGGPGCSSLGGFFGELGPFFVKKDGVTLYENPYSWNKVASVIYLESPAGVGFSYSHSKKYATNDNKTADDNYKALQSFFDKFPQFQKNEFFVTGESYGGIYIPMLCVRILNGKPKFNFKGFAIGNGVLNVRLMAISLVFFGYFHGLIGVSEWEDVTKACCNGSVPSKDTCDFMGEEASKSCFEQSKKVTEHIRAEELNIYNVYDLCYQSEVTSSRYLTDRWLFLDIVSGFGMDDISPLEIAEEKSQAPKKQFEGKKSNITQKNKAKQIITGTEKITGKVDPENMHVKSEPKMDQINREIQKHQTSQKPKNIPDPKNRTSQHHKPSKDDLKPSPACTDSVNVTYYLNQKSVREALRIPNGLPKWTACNHELHPLYEKQYDSMHGHFLELINSGKVRGLVYHGDVDSVCNYLGNMWFTNGLDLHVEKEYAPWQYDNQIAGFVKYFRNLTYMTILGSGHMVPADKPGPALKMLSSFLKNEPL